MDWDDLRYVLALRRTGTLAAAGARLGVAHSTVGRRLKVVEEALGSRLFDRTPEGYVLTDAGEDLVGTAAQIEEDLLAVQERIRGRDRVQEGPLRVSTMDLFFCGLPELFSSFVTACPRIDLSVTTTLDPVSLLRREADVVIRLSNAPPDDLVGRRVGRVAFAVYAADELVATLGDDAPLSAYPWLGFASGPEALWADRWIAEHAPGARIACRIDDNARARCTAIEHGIGVFFLPCLEGDALSGVRRLSPILDALAHDVWLLTLRELRSTGQVRAFLDHATAAFAAAAPRLAGRGVAGPQV